MTTLIKWAPFQEFDVIDRRMRRMLESFGVAPALLPAADLYETEKELIVELDVPGYDEKELALEVSDHTLTVKGERLEAKDEKDKPSICTSGWRSTSSGRSRCQWTPRSRK